MKKYVVGFMFNEERDTVVLVKKERPDWQKGRWNGVGGHIEDGEIAREAMVREFYEETGIDTSYLDWTSYANALEEDNFSIVFYYAIGDIEKARTMTDEIIELKAIESIPYIPTIENLNWLIHLAIDSMDGRPRWTTISYSSYED